MRREFLMQLKFMPTKVFTWVRENVNVNVAEPVFDILRDGIHNHFVVHEAKLVVPTEHREAELTVDDGEVTVDTAMLPSLQS